MTKEDIISKLEQCIERLNILDAVKDVLPDIIDKTLIDNWVSCLNILVEDINSDDIPESFYDKINNIIANLRIANLPNDKDAFIASYNSKNVDFAFPLNREAIKLISNSQEYLDSFSFYKSLGYGKQNTVIVGANGCGKTSLANILTKTLDKKDGIVIPAQKLLIVPTFGSTPNYDTTIASYNSYQSTIFDDKQTFNASKDNDIPYNLIIQYGSEYRFILSALLSERL